MGSRNKEIREGMKGGSGGWMGGWKERMRKGGVEELRDCAIMGSRNKEIAGGMVREREG